jgi:serine/threonine-protein kinase BUR1
MSTTPQSGSVALNGRSFLGCSKIDNYTFLEKLGEGTFGEVHKAQDKSTAGLVALKRIFLHNEEEGFPITALREIRILKELDHENIIPLLDMSVQRGDRSARKRGLVYMVTPYMDHDLTGLLENPSVRLSVAQIKCYLLQILQGVNFMHQNGYLHRDIKASNILIDNNGIVKIADFGLARKYLEPPPTEAGAGAGNNRYTSMVVTRWYRPPELILGECRYTTAIDMWGVGCVFGEMFKRRPILQGRSDADQGQLIFQLVGPPTEEKMPGFDTLPGAKTVVLGPYTRTLETTFKEIPEQAKSLLSGLLLLNPQKRLSALGALAHPFLHTDPMPARPQDLPKYADSHEMTSRKNRDAAKNGHDRAPHAPNATHAVNPLPRDNATSDYGLPQKPHRGGHWGGHGRDRQGRHGRRRTPVAPYLNPPYRKNDESDYRRYDSDRRHHGPDRHRQESDLRPPYRRRGQDKPQLHYDDDKRG